MNADGSERRMLARNHGYVAWSPDGRKILLRRGGAQGDRNGVGATKAYAVVANADGSGLRTLTRIAVVNGQTLNWSPDGRKIVFVSYRDGNQEIYVMNADGSGRRNLTRHPGHDSDPAWSPDGRKIAFATMREGDFEIYVMNADGSGQRNLTRNPAGLIAFPSGRPGRRNSERPMGFRVGRHPKAGMNPAGPGRSRTSAHRFEVLARARSAEIDRDRLARLSRFG